MNTHYDFKSTRATVTFTSSQDADDLIRDIQGCTVRSGHFCNVESVTITETRRVKLSVKLTPLQMADIA